VVHGSGRMTLILELLLFTQFRFFEDDRFFEEERSFLSMFPLVLEALLVWILLEFDLG
jgi:hypothetical protein